MPQPSEVTDAYRARTGRLTAHTYRDLLRLWPAFNPDDPAAIGAWLSAAITLTRRDYGRAEGLAVDYATIHAAASGVRLTASAASPIEAVAVKTSLQVTSIAAYRAAVNRGADRDKALRIAYVRSSGAAVRHALSGGRSALMNTAKAHPQAVQGWRRAGSPQCGWCKALIGRGAIYRSFDTADFAAHDHCSCSVENVYTEAAISVRSFTPGSRASAANNARIREYLRSA